MTNHNTNEGSKFQAIKGGIEMTNSMLHNKINASIKILGGLALGAMLVTSLALPMTASADPAVLPLTKAIQFETSDVGPYEDMLPIAEQVTRWESPDVGPYEIAAPKVTTASRFETSGLDAYES